MALISPMVPMEIRSSMPTPELSNLRAIYTTSRRLWVMSRSLASLSPSAARRIASASSAEFSGGGSVSAPLI